MKENPDGHLFAEKRMHDLVLLALLVCDYNFLAGIVSHGDPTRFGFDKSPGVYLPEIDEG